MSTFKRSTQLHPFAAIECIVSVFEKKNMKLSRLRDVVSTEVELFTQVCLCDKINPIASFK